MRIITVEQTNAAPDPALHYPAVIASRGASPRQYGEEDAEESHLC
jgi:hypothetical protein